MIAAGHLPLKASLLVRGSMRSVKMSHFDRNIDRQTVYSSPQAGILDGLYFKAGVAIAYIRALDDHRSQTEPLIDA